MELEALKTRLATVQSLYVDENSSADDIVYATFGFVREAHIVAKLLLLEGRYAELQRCLHLCQSVFYPPQSEARPTSSSMASLPASSSTRLRRGSTTTTAASQERSPACPSSLAVTTRSQASSTSTCQARDFPALQHEFWAFLNDEDASLFRALFQRTQRFQKQLDEARQTRQGRNTAYYIHKLVDARAGDGVSEARTPAASQHRPLSAITTTTNTTTLPLLSTLRSSSRPPGALGGLCSTPAPPPPERGVSLGNRTKLNQWKIDRELPPFVTRSRTFLGSGAETEDDAEPFGEAPPRCARTSADGRVRSLPSSTLAPLSGSDALTSSSSRAPSPPPQSNEDNVDSEDHRMAVTESAVAPAVARGRLEPLGGPEDVEGLVQALQTQMALSQQRAATVSSTVAKALAPHRPSPPPPVVSTVQVQVDGVSARALSAFCANHSRTLLSSMSSRPATAESLEGSGEEAEADADGEEDGVPLADEDAWPALQPTPLPHSFVDEDAPNGVTVRAEGTPACGSPGDDEEAAPHLVLVTADCSADQKMHALDACGYQAHPQVRDLIYAHLLREKADENMVLDRLLNADRKAALQPPLGASASALDGALNETAFSVPASPSARRRSSTDVGTATVSYLRSRGAAHMFGSTTATRSQTVFNELRTADKEVRRRSRVLGLSATSDDAPIAPAGAELKRLSGSGVARARADGGAGPESSYVRPSIMLPNVFYVEDVDDVGGADVDDWDATMNASCPGRTASTVSELKSTLTAMHPSFRSKRTLTGLGAHTASFTGFGARAPSRKASLFSFRAATGAPSVPTVERPNRARKSSVVGFSAHPARQQATSPTAQPGASTSRLITARTVLESSVITLADLADVPDWTTVPARVLQSSLELSVCAVRIQVHWRAFAARKHVHRLARRVHRHREETIRQGIAARRLQRVWRARLARKSLQHRRALRDYVEQRRVMDELALNPSTDPDLDEHASVARRGSFYLSRPMRYASYASLSNVGDSEHPTRERSPPGTPEDGAGTAGACDQGFGTFLTPASAGPPARARAGSRLRAASATARRRSARNSFHMVPTAAAPPGPGSSRRGSLIAPSRLTVARRGSLAQANAPADNTTRAATPSGLRIKSALPTFGTPASLSAARTVALRHLQRHVAARAITRFLRESIARGERRMQREVFAFSHYLTGQWTRVETEAFIKEQGLDANDEDGDAEEEEEEEAVLATKSRAPNEDDEGNEAPSFLIDMQGVDAAMVSSEPIGVGGRSAHAGTPSRALLSPLNATAGTSSFLTLFSSDVGSGLASNFMGIVSTPPALRAEKTRDAAKKRPPKGTGSLAKAAPRTHVAVAASTTSAAAGAGAGAGAGTGDADAESSLNIAALVHRATGDVYAKFLARSAAARDSGDRLTVLHKVSLTALEAERQRLAAEAARIEAAHQQRQRQEAEERRAREARRVEAVSLLQRVGRACRRRTWLRSRHQEVVDRRSLQYRSQLFTSGFAESSMQSLEGSVDLFSSGVSALCGAETEQTIPAQSSLYIHRLLSARHPGWYSHDTRRQQAVQTASVVLIMQRFLRAHVSTDVAFQLYLHQQATTVQRVWRGHCCRARTGSLKALVAQRLDVHARHAAESDADPSCSASLTDSEALPDMVVRQEEADQADAHGED